MKVIGHRGAKGLAPENTLAAIQKALALGVDEIEIDVRLSSDNHLVLIHDATLKRLTGNPAAIHDQTLQELKAIKPDVTTLEEVIVSINKKVPLLVEVKNPESVSFVVACLKSFITKGWTTDHFLLASFKYSILRSLHHNLPEIGIVVNEKWSGVRGSRRARRLGTTRIHMQQRWLWGGFISSMHRSDFQVCAYPLNNPVKAKAWAKRGLYGVITDFPDRFAKRYTKN